MRVSGPSAHAQRQENIGRFEMERGTGTILEIVDAFGVSAMTVHRDLRDLADQGVVRRFRGGASAQPSGVFKSIVRYRMSSMLEEKAAIAQVALTMIEPGMSILLDEGTTTLALARLLGDISPLTVITNHLETIKVVSAWPNIRLISLGGEYRANDDSFVGLQCAANLNAMNVDLAFISTSAVGGGAASHQEQEIVLVKQAIMENSSRRVLLVDHSKLGAVALFRFAALSEFDLLITDDGISASQLEDLETASVRYSLAPHLN